MDVDCWEPGAQAGTLFSFASNCVDFMLQVPDFASVFYYLHNSSNLPRPPVFLTIALILQLQATVLSLLASLMAILLGWMAEGKMPFGHAVLLCSTSVSTVFVASLLQGNNTTCNHCL